MEEIVVGIDVGTTKVCTLVGRVENANSMRILGVGIGPSAGLTKGMVDNIQAATEAIASSVVSDDSGLPNCTTAHSSMRSASLR